MHLAAMLAQMNDRGPDSAGVAVYRDPAPSGSSKLTLFSGDPREDWAALAASLGAGEPDVRASHAVFVVESEAADAEEWVRANRPDLRVMSAGSVIEIYKETGLPRDFVERVRAHRHPGDTRARPHAHGDREPRDDRGLAPVLDRLRPLPRAQRLALEPQPAAREPAPRGDRVPDRERHRGRRRLPRVADARGRDPRAGARGLPHRSRRLLHLRGRHRGRLRGAPRPDRVQAGGARRDRRLGRDGLRVAGDLGPARAPRRRGCGSRSPASSTSGRRSPHERGRRRRKRRRSRSSTSRRRRFASSTGVSTSWRARRARAPGASSIRTGRTRSRAGSTRRSRSRSRGTSATTAPA